LIYLFLILEIFNILQRQTGPSYDLHQLVLHHKVHLLLQRFYFWKVVYFKQGSHLHDHVLEGCIFLGIDEVVRYFFGVGEGHFVELFE
jgi:hypothetical protein